MLAGLHALNRLLCVQLRRRAQDYCIGIRSESLAQLRRRVVDPIPLRDLLSRRNLTTHDRDHLDAIDLLQSIEMLLPEGADACHHDFHRPFSRMRWPTAVFDAGT